MNSASGPWVRWRLCGRSERHSSNLAILWRAKAAETFERAGLDAPSLMEKLKGQSAAGLLREVA
jgi:hypothetical protein